MTFGKYKDFIVQHVYPIPKKPLPSRPPRHGQLYFPPLGTEQLKKFNNQLYEQGAFSSSKDTIESYKKNVLKPSNIKFKQTKNKKYYQLWLKR